MSIKALKSLIGEHGFTEQVYLYEENSFGITRRSATPVAMGFTIGIHDEESGYFDMYDIETQGEEWYAEGSLEFDDGKLVGYDGVFSLSPTITEWLKERGVDVSEVECN